MASESRTLNRRTFLRQTACAAVGATAMVNTLSYLRLTSAALAQAEQPANDYKALVCLFLNGGNDANNLLFPAGSAATNPMRSDYESGRGMLTIHDLSNALVLPSSTSVFNHYYPGMTSPMAVHPSAPEIAELFNAGDLAFVCNVGTLTEPILTRDAYIHGTVAVPDDLFSHSHQQLQWQTSVANSSSRTGWGGRIADLLHAAGSADSSKVSMSISLSGLNSFQRGLSKETIPFVVGAQGAETLKGYGDAPERYNHAYEEGSSFANPIYKNNRIGARLRALETLLRLSREDLFEDTYVKVATNARVVEETIGSAFTFAEALGIDFDQIFSNVDTQLSDQLKAIAKLIGGRTALGNSRQIFFVEIGGYDIHKDHLEAHALLMDELSKAMMAFRNALKALNEWDNVVTFTASDFNRTLTPNGITAADGTDHAWGSHAMIMGGPVIGGQLYGHFPPLKVGEAMGSVDADSVRGRFIPSVAVDQYASVLARWFGADSNAMEEIFPNLGRFDDPLTSASPNLKFLHI